MTLLIGFLTMVLVLNSLFLGLLILIQLPKKEAGIGVAFGSSATDALFGAGSGNALTKMTKYSASLFLILALALSSLTSHRSRQSSRLLDQELQRKAAAPAAVPPSTPSSKPVTLPTTTDLSVIATNVATTNSTAPTKPQ